MKKIYKVQKFKTDSDWLLHRGIGGSSASAILNQNPYMSANELYDQIVFHSKKESDYENEVTIRGKSLEPLIRNEFKFFYKDTFKVIEPPKHNWIFKRIDKPFLTASLDGVLIDLKTKEKGVLEIKTKEVKSESEALKWELGTIPQNYYIQCLHYLMVTGFTYCFIVSHLIKKNYQTNELEWVKMNIQKIYRKGKEEELVALENIETNFYKNCLDHKRPRAIFEVLRRRE